MGRVLAISGGVGGAKLALGLERVLGADRLAVVVNTADDFQHLGLHISPDIDTLLYTLSGRANREQGWGLDGESWQVMDALAALDGETWFRLGDRDLATHLYRTGRLASGATLSEVTAELAARMGVSVPVLPMCDEPVSTRVQTPEGDMPFQRYFVARGCEPVARGFEFAGLDRARPSAALLEYLEGPVDAVVVCPSNPFVSVAPVLGVPGLAALVAEREIPVCAVSPIIGQRAVKGPAAKMLRELGMPVSARAVMAHYAETYPGLVSRAVIDSVDREQVADIAALGMAVSVAPTLMRSLADREQLARHVLAELGV